MRLHHNLSQPNLREKITAQDVFMIREMYEQLKAGKEVDLDIERESLSEMKLMSSTSSQL